MRLARIGEGESESTLHDFWKAALPSVPCSHVSAMGMLEGRGRRLRLLLTRISRGPVVTSAVVFIVPMFPGVQSKQGRYCQVPHGPGQEANLFICQLLTIIHHHTKTQTDASKLSLIRCQRRNVDSLNEPVL